MDGAILMKSHGAICTKEELKNYFREDRNACFGKTSVNFEDKFRKPFKQKLYKYFKYFRKYDYYCHKRDSSKNFLLSKVYSLVVKYCDIRKNNISLKINIEMSSGCIGKNVRICHPNVILNGTVGDSCVFHGNNVLGNKKTGDATATPKLGKNVDVGIGAMIIGDVTIADNCIIGAGAVVTKSFTEPGSVIVGVPARKIAGE